MKISACVIIILVTHSLYCLGVVGWALGYLSLAGRIGETLEIFYSHHNTTGGGTIYHSQERKTCSFCISFLFQMFLFQTFHCSAAASAALVNGYSSFTGKLCFQT